MKTRQTKVCDYQLYGARSGEFFDGRANPIFSDGRQVRIAVPATIKGEMKTTLRCYPLARFQSLNCSVGSFRFAVGRSELGLLIAPLFPHPVEVFQVGEPAYRSGSAIAASEHVDGNLEAGSAF